MNLATAAFALAAMLPAMVDGTLADQGRGQIALALCSGGSVLLSPGTPPEPRPASTACCAKGCRENLRRRRNSSGAFDQAQ